MLNGGKVGRHMSKDEARAYVAERGVPFEPSYQREDGTWEWLCPKLTADGRCSIYDDRPVTCRDYEPASDRLCVHWRGAEGTDSGI